MSCFAMGCSSSWPTNSMLVPSEGWPWMKELGSQMIVMANTLVTCTKWPEHAKTMVRSHYGGIHNMRVQRKVHTQRSWKNFRKESPTIAARGWAMEHFLSAWFLWGVFTGFFRTFLGTLWQGNQLITIKARSRMGVWSRAPLMAGARHKRLNSPPSKALIYMFEPTGFGLPEIQRTILIYKTPIWVWNTCTSYLIFVSGTTGDASVKIFTLVSKSPELTFKMCFSESQHYDLPNCRYI